MNHVENTDNISKLHARKYDYFMDNKISHARKYDYFTDKKLLYKIYYYFISHFTDRMNFICNKFLSV